jgi:ABC-type Na+ efflux pump permease subunit
VVILVFFALLADLQAKAPAWLLWAPPFTPFIVLVRPWLGIGEILGPALLFLAAAGLSAFAAAWAIRAERLTRGTAPRPPVEP